MGVVELAGKLQAPINEHADRLAQQLLRSAGRAELPRGLGVVADLVKSALNPYRRHGEVSLGQFLLDRRSDCRFAQVLPTGSVDGGGVLVTGPRAAQVAFPRAAYCSTNLSCFRDKCALAILRLVSSDTTLAMTARQSWWLPRSGAAFMGVEVASSEPRVTSARCSRPAGDCSSWSDELVPIGNVPTAPVTGGQSYSHGNISGPFQNRCRPSDGA